MRWDCTLLFDLAVLGRVRAWSGEMGWVDTAFIRGSLRGHGTWKLSTTWMRGNCTLLLDEAVLRCSSGCSWSWLVDVRPFTTGVVVLCAARASISTHTRSSSVRYLCSTWVNSVILRQWLECTDLRCILRSILAVGVRMITFSLRFSGVFFKFIEDKLVFRVIRWSLRTHNWESLVSCCTCVVTWGHSRSRVRVNHLVGHLEHWTIFVGVEIFEFDLSCHFSDKMIWVHDGLF